VSIGSLLSRLVGAKSKAEDKPKNLKAAERSKTGAAIACNTASDNTAVIATPEIPAPPPRVELPEVPIDGSELRYYKPFGPADSIFDVWMKLQTFVSTEPITVRLSPSDDTGPIYKSDFVADGTVHSTREAFYQDLTASLRNAGPSGWRAVRRLSRFGIPSHAPEGSYHFFTGSLRIELRGVRIMGLPFTLGATFEPNLGLIPRHFAHAAEYLHCEMVSSDGRGRGREAETTVVGFPWSLTAVTLYSEDRRLDQQASTITKAIHEKYARHVQQDQVLTAGSVDPRKFTVISDGVVAIAMHEGVFETKTTQGKFLQIEYSPVPRGRLDEVTAGDVEFLAFAKALADMPKEEVVEAVAAMDTPF
jgi:hypothetical protein